MTCIFLIVFITSCQLNEKAGDSSINSNSDTTNSNETMQTNTLTSETTTTNVSTSVLPGSQSTMDGITKKPTKTNATTTTSKASAASTTKAVSNLKYMEVLKDPYFKSGFNVRGLSPITDGESVRAVFNYGNNKLNPSWILGQWSSRYSFADNNTLDKLGGGVYRYNNPNKTVTVNTSTGEIALKAFASKCYDAPRKEGESWMHLLLEQDFLSGNHQNLDKYSVQLMKEFRVKMQVKLSYFVDQMNGQAKRGLHAAQYTMFLTISDRNPNNSSGYGDGIWFGVPVFDNRREVILPFAQEDAGQAGASGKFIYSLSNASYMNSNFFVDGTPVGKETNKWITIDVDVLPYIKEAFNMAKERGYLKQTNYNELYISGMNIGWELPGTYDVEMKMKNFSLLAGK